jgi:hypothetical protein
MEDYFEEYEENEPEELFRSPNGGAYEKQELRTGPPLDYVAEKYRSSLEMTHYLLGTVNNSDIKNDLKDTLLSQIRGALRYQLTGYLALKNMLAVVSNEGIFQRIEHYSREDFSDWLNGVDQQGSVQG